MAILVLNPNGLEDARVTTLEAARTAAWVAGKTVVVTSALTQAHSNISGPWPADRALEIKKGGSIANSTAFAFAAGVSFFAGDYQVFAGSGAVTGLNYANVQWFGTNTNPGATDMTAAIKAAIASVARADSSSYTTGATVFLPKGEYRATASIPVPYGIGIEGTSPANTLIIFDTNTSTDGLTWTGTGGNFLDMGFIKNIRVYAANQTKVRDLIVLNGVANFTLENVQIDNAGRRNLSVIDSVNVRGYKVMSSGAKTNGVYIDTAGASVNTTTSFYGSAFRLTTDGYGADVAGIGISFDACYFESNGWTDTVSGGIIARNGTVTLNGPYFEDNAGPNIYLGTVGAAIQEYTVINVHMVKNPTHAGAGSFGAYLKSGYITLVGGDYSISGNTLYIDTTNVYFLNMMGVLSYPSAPTLSAGTMADVKGLIALNDVVTGKVRLQGDLSDTTWIAPTLLNSWANYGGALETAGYMKDAFGVVHIKGAIKTGTSGTVAFNLPAGYRPSATVWVPAMGDPDSGYLQIEADGDVIPVITGASTQAGLRCSFKL